MTPSLSDLLLQIESGASPSSRTPQIEKDSISNGLLLCQIGTNDPLRIVLPADMDIRRDFLHEHHDACVAATLAAIKPTSR